ncbi:hypothetical protein HAX54_012772, partial [Datura stramonium]|nr:hypothetical protein [Datura stramonium]
MAWPSHHMRIRTRHVVENSFQQVPNYIRTPAAQVRLLSLQSKIRRREIGGGVSTTFPARIRSAGELELSQVAFLPVKEIRTLRHTDGA